ncbi:MAG: hypothetical protein U5P10_14745 [Spirochaetia bacterium]|nr:hypothetical protein [Spirochaetia bacterium]
MKLIKNEKDYEQALSRVEELIDIEPLEGSDEAEELELLALLINTYEDKVYPIKIPDGTAGFDPQ